MKKSIIAAGAASIALAAMPIVGVFADDDRSATDTIQVTVSSSCTFSAGGDDVVSYSATGTNATGKVDPAHNSSSDHTFTVFCNNNGGYNVTAKATALTDSTVSGDNFAYKAALPTSESDASAKADGSWHAEFEGAGVTAQLPDGGADNGNAVKIVSRNEASAADGETFKATYSAWIGTETPSGTYTGTIIYTLAPGA